MKYTLQLLTILCSAYLQSTRIPFLDGLDNIADSQHCTVWCTPQDYDIASTLVQDVEILWQELSQEFGKTCETKITLAVYPNLVMLHQAMNWPHAPDWCIGRVSSQGIWSASPHNPGPLHSFESVMHGFRVKIIQIFMYGIYSTGHEPFPLLRWIHQGVALYRAGFYNPTHVRYDLACQKAQLPTLAQLERASDTETFDRFLGFKASYSLIHFLIDQYGWDTVLAILADYTQFEAIVGLSKEQFSAQWVEWLSEPLLA